MSGEQARLLNLALNKISGDWDEQLLARLLADLRPVRRPRPHAVGLRRGRGDEARSSGSTPGRSGSVRRRFDLDAALEAAPARAADQARRLWRLGDHRLLCGDATDADDVARLLGGRRADMAFTDPPYNVALGDHGGQQPGRAAAADRQRRARPRAVGGVLPRLGRHPRRDGRRRDLRLHVHQGMAARQPRVLAEAGGHWSDTIIWAKDRFVLGRADYQRAVRADLVRLARGGRASLVRRPRPGRRLVRSLGPPRLRSTRR